LAQPTSEIIVVEVEDATFRGCQNFGKDLRHGLPFQVDVGSRLVHRCVQVRMAEPLTDGGEVDSCLEKANCSRMSH